MSTTSYVTNKLRKNESPALFVFIGDLIKVNFRIMTVSLNRIGLPLILTGHVENIVEA